MSDLERLIADTQQLLDAATPGNWQVLNDDLYDEDVQVVVMPDPATIDPADKWVALPTVADVVHQPDARLIAAAPGLLTELLDVARRHQQTVELCEFLIDACATHRIPVPLNSSLLDLAADIAGGAVLIDVETTGGTT